MATKVEVILQEALAMSPSERAMMAHYLISSIDEPTEAEVEQEWLKLAEKRLAEADSHEVAPISWETLKQRVRNARSPILLSR